MSGVFDNRIALRVKATIQDCLQTRLGLSLNLVRVCNDGIVFDRVSHLDG
jgi:hypothetical protein